MNAIAVEMKNVSKSFGKQKVLKNVSMKLEQGGLYGLTGDNGSGKSVLMRLICGFSDADEGEVFVLGRRVSSRSSHSGEIGVIIETPAFVSRCSAKANLKLLASILGKCRNEDIDHVLERVGLSDAGKKPVGKFSLGMRQRLAIAQAIMEKPPILLLDEPFNGLDRHGMEEVQKLLKEINREGTTIMLTSHYQRDIDALCGRIFMLENGELTMRGETEGHDE